MAIKIIPEQRIYTCDRCGKTSEYQSFLSVKIELPGRDYVGSICGPGGTFELCQNCGERDLSSWINNFKNIDNITQCQSCGTKLSRICCPEDLLNDLVSIRKRLTKEEKVQPTHAFDHIIIIERELTKLLALKNK